MVTYIIRPPCLYLILCREFCEGTYPYPVSDIFEELREIVLRDEINAEGIRNLNIGAIEFLCLRMLQGTLSQEWCRPALLMLWNCASNEDGLDIFEALEDHKKLVTRLADCLTTV